MTLRETLRFYYRTTKGRQRRNQKKAPVRKFIAYFQAFTNTYAPVDHLEKIFTEAINDPDVCALSIATRPDCLPPAVLELLGRLNRIKPVWVELGLQTVNSETARFIRRGYPTDVFDHAVHRLRMLGITVIVHVILFLPYETKEMMFHTIDHLNKLDIQGIKLQLLHILKGTDLAAVYEKHIFTYLIWKNISNCSGHVSQNCALISLFTD